MFEPIIDQQVSYHGDVKISGFMLFGSWKVAAILNGQTIQIATRETFEEARTELLDYLRSDLGQDKLEKFGGGYVTPKLTVVEP